MTSLFYCTRPMCAGLGSFILVFSILLAGCARTPPVPSATAPGPTANSSTVTPVSSPTPAPPTPTPLPLAARVGQVEVSLAEYEAELIRYQQALGRDLTDEDRRVVLDDLVSQALLDGAAYEEGFSLSEEDLQTRINQLTATMGGDQALAEWMKANSYTEEQFRQALARSAAAAWMRDQIISGVPETAEQVHARQLLFRTQEEASQALALLQAGSDFERLASEADPLTGGELGWLPRGILFHPELDDTVFALQPGQYTTIIQTPSGYHIVQVIERDPQRMLDPQARLVFQEKALKDWLERRREQVEIEIFV